MTCIAVMFATVFYPNTSILVKATEEKEHIEGNVTTYIPEGKTEKTAHTIYWAKGITPPKMPNIVESKSTAKTKGEFSLVDIPTGNIVKRKKDLTVTIGPKGDKLVNASYITDFIPGAGWYDAKKFTPFAIGDEVTPEEKIDGVTDSNLCWAASAANILQWWMDNNRALIEKYVEMDKKVEGLGDPKLLLDYFAPQSFTNNADGQYVKNNPIFRLLRKSSIGDNGGYPTLAFDLFLNGYKITDNEKSHNDEKDFTPDKNAGFFNAAFGKKLLSSRGIPTRNYDYMSDSLKEWLNKGYGVVLTHKVRKSSHGITLWGAEYDENGNLCGLYITDSNERFSTFGERGRPHDKIFAMKRYDAFNADNALAITHQQNPKFRGKNYLYDSYLLMPATEQLQYFVDHGKQMPQDGNYFP